MQKKTVIMLPAIIASRIVMPQEIPITNKHLWKLALPTVMYPAMPEPMISTSANMCGWRWAMAINASRCWMTFR